MVMIGIRSTSNDTTMLLLVLVLSSVFVALVLSL